MISFRSEITKKVLGYFFLHEGSQMYINEMARRFDVDSGNLTRKLEQLQKEGLLMSEFQGMERYFTLNRDFPLYKEYKKIVLKSIGIEEALRKKLENIPGVEQAILFGSYATNQMEQHSDIDLLLVGNHSTLEASKALAALQKTIDRPINCFQLGTKEFQKTKNKKPLLKNIFNGKHKKIL